MADKVQNESLSYFARYIYKSSMKPLSIELAKGSTPNMSLNLLYR